MEVVKLNNISRFFSLGNSQVNALKNVNLSVNKGEFLVLKGSSGSGKSTLLNIIGAMDEASTGEVEIAGKPLNKLSDAKKSKIRQKHIGFIFQSFNLLPVLTALENVQYPLSLQGDKNSKNKAIKALAQVGLADFIHHRPNQLSGGQMQRVAIARALVTQPDIILADEPTANLDSVTAKSIMELMKQLNQQGITFIFATHHEFVLTQASRIIELKDGQIMHDKQKAAA
ncbi:ABC transporter ATP-binding protein [Pseudoalteromonas denitrificans]|uniref:Putative ABC transport system ATP-binding protein n=1 Tax=Pseudoalteromonas denitrificans DSM 6059 TaxID=1123010 RepID=A0A1I1IDF7_9GAMM|nr:ABC transporter ATP-binding protein [Pseudoalteromonas denitrificans]SFC32238.1 putative ABC transport system ATP-binding protein [Pseudoalteromonas denitrificans DSM 6059]